MKTEWIKRMIALSEMTLVQMAFPRNSQNDHRNESCADYSVNSSLLVGLKNALRRRRYKQIKQSHNHFFRLPVSLLIALILLYACSTANAAPGKESPVKLRTITSANEAHNLSTEEAARAYPVHLRGVITAIDPSDSFNNAAAFIHDSTGSIYVVFPDDDVIKKKLSAGTVVDLQGVTGPGTFAPIIDYHNLRVQVIGHSPLPEKPPRESYAYLASGAADAKWVEVEGIVHSVIEHINPRNPSEGFVTLKLALADGVIGVLMLREAGANYSRLVDATVRIHANAAPSFNRNDQMMGARLMAPGLSEVQVVKAAPGDPFEQPSILIDDLLRWDQLASERHRVHVRGRVTMLWPGTSFCLRDASRGICAQTLQQTHLELGELADVVGFAGSENGTPILTDAVYRSAGNTMPLTATRVSAEQALLGYTINSTSDLRTRSDYDSELIQLEGQLIGNDLTSADTALLLTSGQTVFTAVLPKSLTGSEVRSLKTGSKLLVTGICSVRLDPASLVTGAGVADAKSFRILLRSPADVVVLKRPSWWTPTHAFAVLALVLTGTLVVLGWVVALRRRVKQQTSLLRESEQRFRHMALHDSLTGLATRLLFHDRLISALENAKRRQTGLALLMVDIDKFKMINDTYGHQAGDEVLRVSSLRLREAVRKTDTVARLGGDEFIVLLADLRNPKMAEKIAGNLVKNMAEPILFEGREVLTTVSIGVCIAAAGELDSDTLLKNVDEVLYQAKAQGRNRYVVYTASMAGAEINSRSSEAV